MLSDYFTDMDKVAIYAMVAFFIFFIFFIAVTVYTIRINKRTTQEFGNIPLDDGSAEIDSEYND